MPRPKKVVIDPIWIKKIYALIPNGKTAPESNLEKVIRPYGVTTKLFIDYTLNFILSRIDPAKIDCDITFFFSTTDHHLDASVARDGKSNIKKGYWMMSHPHPMERKAGTQICLHRQLQRIFCPIGDECVKGKDQMLHIRATKKEKEYFVHRRISEKNLEI